MNDKVLKTKRQFVLTSVFLAVVSVLILGFALYEANVIRFSDDLGSEELQSAVAEHHEVAAYLEAEHQNEAHFITIANIIKNDQQQTLGNTILWVTVPVLIIVAVIGYFVAKRLLKPVQEAYEAQDRFIADAAHELRNPLAAMSAVTQNAARKKTLSPDQFKKFLLQLRRQLSRMVHINEDLLYLERDIETNKDISVNVSELLQDVIEDLQPQAHDRSISFKLNVEANVMSDIAPKDFVRLAKNIIENAIKYSKPSSKTVSVKLTGEKGDVKLVVKDSGIGIPEADQTQISQRFFRGSNVGDLPGTGLGLAIVAKITEHRAGQLEIKSVAKKGTTVSVLL